MLHLFQIPFFQTVTSMSLLSKVKHICLKNSLIFPLLLWLPFSFPKGYFSSVRNDVYLFFSDLLVELPVIDCSCNMGNGE